MLEQIGSLLVDVDIDEETATATTFDPNGMGDSDADELFAWLKARVAQPLWIDYPSSGVEPDGGETLIVSLVQLCGTAGEADLLAVFDAGGQAFLSSIEAAIPGAIGPTQPRSRSPFGISAWPSRATSSHADERKIPASSGGAHEDPWSRITPSGVPPAAMRTSIRFEARDVINLHHHGARPNEHRSVFRKQDMENSAIAFVFRQDAEHDLVDFGASSLQLFVVERLGLRNTQEARCHEVARLGQPDDLAVGAKTRIADDVPGRLPVWACFDTSSEPAFFGTVVHSHVASSLSVTRKRSSTFSRWPSMRRSARVWGGSVPRPVRS